MRIHKTLFSLLNSLSIFALEQYFEIQIAFHNSQIIMRPSVRVNKGKINKILKRIINQSLVKKIIAWKRNLKDEVWRDEFQ